MQKQLDEVAGRLAAELASWHAIELRTHDEVKNYQAAIGPPEARIDYHYVEVAGGRRLYEFRLRPSEGAGGSHGYYADGSRFADASYPDGLDSPATQVTIKRAFSIEGEAESVYGPVPYPLFFIGRAPLHSAIGSAKRLDPARHLDRDCDRFLFAGVKQGYSISDSVYWLDPETSFPIKVENYQDASQRAAGRPRTVWSAESLDEVGGRHFPLRSSLAMYGAGGELQSERTIVVDEIRFDGEYPASIFWPVLGPGTRVIDLTTKQTMVVPKAEVAAGDALTAEPRGGWQGPATTSALVLGAALLIAAVVVWWRRR